MKVTDRTRRHLAIRREEREMEKNGWIYVSEAGGQLWKLHRGAWIGKRITDVKIAVHGLGLFVKIGDAA